MFYNDFFSYIYEYIDTERNGSPKFSVNDVFDVGSRTIEVLAISDSPDEEGIWHYFVKLIEHEVSNGTWYETFNQIEMEIVKLGDIRNDAVDLTEKLSIVRDIIRLNKGVMNSLVVMLM